MEAKTHKRHKRGYPKARIALMGKMVVIFSYCLPFFQALLTRFVAFQA